MGVLNFIQKHRIPLLIVTVLILAVFYLWSDISSVSIDFLQGRKPQIRKILTCKPVHLDVSVLNARKELADMTRVLIHFNEKPSSDVREFLATEGVTIYPDSWVYDYLVGEAPVNKLCFLDTLPGITGISIGE